jgi:predicted ATPase
MKKAPWGAFFVAVSRGFAPLPPFGATFTPEYLRKEETKGAHVMRVVVSGCSGGGKSTLLAEMAARGWACFEEPGRRVVAEGLFPWQAIAGFCARCVTLAEQDFHAAGPGVSLFDRSFLDALIWFEQAERPVPGAVAHAVEGLRYHAVVFLAPPWPEIYVQDAARRHEFAAALAEYDALCQRLPKHGYRVEILPKLPLSERADWLEARLKEMA